ncbi:hypothetical protein [Microbacterium aoyamense]|uniref:hypothetical protein n=1 Tax=Microbacterium aoyamense TaxID=344166 RepID=UPI0020041517|nr:hypothetical protein [Microbacterium aoyamense]
MAQKTTIPADTRATVVDSLRLARGRVESAEWYTTHTEYNDPVMVRSLAQTAIFALEAVIEAMRELPSPLEAWNLTIEKAASEAAEIEREALAKVREQLTNVHEIRRPLDVTERIEAVEL